MFIGSAEIFDETAAVLVVHPLRHATKNSSIRVRIEDVDNHLGSSSCLRCLLLGSAIAGRCCLGPCPFLMGSNGLAEGHGSVFLNFYHVLEKIHLVAKLFRCFFRQSTELQVLIRQKGFAVSTFPPLTTRRLVDVQVA